MRLRKAEIAAMLAIAMPIAKRNSFSYQELTSVNRERPLVYTRQEIMFVLYTEHNYSTPKIGQFLNRDNSTVGDGIAAYAKRWS